MQGLKEQSLKCEQVQKLFDDLLHERLDPVLRGRVQGHLLLCDECSIALMLRTRQAVDSGEIVIQVPPPPDLSFIDEQLQAERLGVIWKEKLPEMQMKVLMLALVAAVKHWTEMPYRQRGPVVRTRGGTVPTCEAMVLDVLYQPSGNVSLTVHEPPQITEEGHLTARFATEEMSYEGWTLALTLELPEGEKLTALGKLKKSERGGGLEAHIDEKGFEVAPQLTLEGPLMVPKEQWKVYLLPEGAVL